jgi:hypothetical protein
MLNQFEYNFELGVHKVQLIFLGKKYMEVCWRTVWNPKAMTKHVHHIYLSHTADTTSFNLNLRSSKGGWKNQSKPAHGGMVCDTLPKNIKHGVPSFCRIILHKVCHQVGVHLALYPIEFGKCNIYRKIANLDPIFSQRCIFPFPKTIQTIFFLSRKILILTKKKWSNGPNW